LTRVPWAALERGRVLAYLARSRASVALAEWYSGSPRPAVKQVCLRVAPGTGVALVGPNGAGKNSLLKAIAGLLLASGGALRIYGNAVGECHHGVGYQDTYMVWYCALTEPTFRECGTETPMT